MVRAGVLSLPTLFHPAIDKKLSVRMQPLFTVPILRSPLLQQIDLLIWAHADREASESIGRREPEGNSGRCLRPNFVYTQVRDKLLNSLQSRLFQHADNGAPVKERKRWVHF
jgi:hypothetical protein